MNEDGMGHGTPIRVDGCLEGMRKQEVQVARLDCPYFFEACACVDAVELG